MSRAGKNTDSMSASLNALDSDTENEEASKELQKNDGAKGGVSEFLEPIENNQTELRTRGQIAPNKEHSLGVQIDITRQGCEELTERGEAKGSSHTLHTRRPLEGNSESMDYQQREAMAAMLDMDVRDIEDLGELLKVLNGNQWTKRPVQIDSPEEGVKKVRTENVSVRVHSVEGHTNLGARGKEVGPHPRERENQFKKRYGWNKDVQTQKGHLELHHLPDIFMSDDSEWGEKIGNEPRLICEVEQVSLSKDRNLVKDRLRNLSYHESPNNPLHCSLEAVRLGVQAELETKMSTLKLGEKLRGRQVKDKTSNEGSQETFGMQAHFKVWARREEETDKDSQEESGSMSSSTSYSADMYSSEDSTDDESRESPESKAGSAPPITSIKAGNELEN